MKAYLIGAVAAIALGMSAGTAQADAFLIQLDDTLPGGAVAGNTYQNGLLIQSVTFSNDQIVSPYTLWNGATLSNTFDNQFNFYEPDGVTLSDTVEISGNAGDKFFSVNFQSDAAGMTALLNGGVFIENGLFQEAVDPGTVSNGDFYDLQIASSSRVPEPLTLSLVGAGLAGAVAMRRRKKKIA
jgi:hypothetical protein